MKRVLPILLVPFLLLAATALAGPGSTPAEKVSGQFVGSWKPGRNVEGAVRGDLAGRLETIIDRSPLQDRTMRGRTEFRTSDGVLSTVDEITLGIPDGALVEWKARATIRGGTRKYAGAAGHLSMSGVYNRETGELKYDYTGEIRIERR